MNRLRSKTTLKSTTESEIQCGWTGEKGEEPEG